MNRRGDVGAEAEPSVRFAASTAGLLSRRFGAASDGEQALLVRLMSAVAEGHGCIRIDRDEQGVVAALAERSGALTVVDTGALRDVDPDSIRTPLVAWNGRLFAQRQFRDEHFVAVDLLTRAASPPPGFGVSPRVKDLLQELLPRQDSDGHFDDLQNRAARSVLESTLSVLVGGPGTGKTYTLVRCLALVVRQILEQAVPRSAPPRVVVCAPTGKAATRAAEMLRELQGDAAFRGAVGDEVLQVLSGIRPQTVHRLLGRTRSGAGGRGHRTPPAVAADLLVVDEMSMMSTALLGELLARLDHGTRLLLVGDHAQLESVENGAVLGQIMECRDAIPGVVHELRSVRRTSSGSRIPLLAGAIRDGDSDGVIDELRTGHPSISWTRPSVDRVVPADVVGAVVELLGPVNEIANDPSASVADHRRALEFIGSVKVLCGPRRGPSGVAAWNDAIRRALGFREDVPLHPGTPVLVTVNAPHLGLVNGSVGLVVRTRVNDRVVNRVAFLGLEASTDDGETANVPESREIRYLEPIQLADHEPCFAMTVHKSQGSEYGALVVVVLPTEDSPLLTRELLYTAVTRGKSSVWMVGPEGSIRSAVGRPSGRTSAISQMLALCAAGDAR